MERKRITGLDGFRELTGQHLGYSEWTTITQEQVNTFADATHDHQWIHVDPEAAKSGPFGGTIAHGYLTLSLGPAMLEQIVEYWDVSMGLNYGLNKVRFPSPVLVGSRVRLGVAIDSCTDVAEGQLQVNYVFTFEAEGAAKPVCVAEVIFRMFA